MERAISLCKTCYLDNGANTGSKDKNKRKYFAETQCGGNARTCASKTAETVSSWDCLYKYMYVQVLLCIASINTILKFRRMACDFVVEIHQVGQICGCVSWGIDVGGVA